MVISPQKQADIIISFQAIIKIQSCISPPVKVWPKRDHLKIGEFVILKDISKFLGVVPRKLFVGLFG